MKTNTKFITIDRTIFSRPKFKAGLVLVICALLTFSGVILIKKHISDTFRQEFEVICQGLKNKINSRLDSQVLLLRSCAAFYTASDSITRQEWQDFYLNLKIEDNLPGIQGLGFSLIISPNSIDRHVETIKNEGFKNYSIIPSGKRTIYTSTIFIEPFSGRNLNAFGYDMYSESSRRSAMDKSRDLNMAVLSGKVRLVQETEEDVQSGVVMYVPVYRKSHSITNVNERREAIIGWVFSPYRMKDLMYGILGSLNYLDENGIELEVYDENSENIENLLFTNAKSEKKKEKYNDFFKITLPLEYNGKTWILSFSQNSKFPFFVNLLLLVVFFAAVLISILTSSLTLSILETKISAKRIAEQLTLELKESENRYKALIESTPQSIIVHQNGTLVYANQATLQLALAHSVDEIVGKSIYEFIHPDYQEYTHEKVIEFIEKGTVNSRSEKKLIRLDKQIIDVDLQSTAIIFDGKPSIHVVLMDITERKKAEIALAESESRFRNLFSKHQAIMLLVEEGTDSIIDANESASKFYGYSIARLKKLKISNLSVQMHDKPPDFVGRKREKRNYSIFSHKLSNGEKRIVEVHSTNIDFQHKKLQFLIIHDITDRMLNQQEIILKNTELQKLNTDKDLLMSILAHDLKGPFNSLLGFSELLLENAKKYDTEKIEKHVSFINVAAKNAYNLLENLLIWSRSQSGKIPFEPESHNLVEICEQIISGLHLIAESKSIDLTYTGDPEVFVFADLNMIKTIIRNLLSNSLKFTHKGGKVSISAQMNAIETIIKIQDNGIGMSKEKIDNLFKINAIKTSKGTENEVGTGLGLIICQAFINQHKGSISVESTNGSGTEFKIVFPLKK